MLDRGVLRDSSIKFYHYGSGQRTNQVIGIMQTIGLPFQDIDVKDSGLSAYIPHDLGSGRLPLLLTDDGIQEGYDTIIQYVVRLVMEHQEP